MKATKRQKKEMKRWYQKNRIAAIRRNGIREKIYKAALRLEILAHYCKGEPYCQCPGCHLGPKNKFKVFVGFLQIDHIKGGGNLQKDKNGTPLYGAALWRWIKRNGFPRMFQILCANCNSPGGKGRHRKCPMHGKPH